YARIAEGSQPSDLFKFDTLSGAQLKMPFQPKGMHDEMNSANFDEWGRMTANLGLEAPGATPLLQNIILYPYVNPATEILDSTGLPSSLHVTPIASAADGTQIWKITHNGVDTHPIHFHLYDVQIINRVTWDNIIIPPEPSELGWKDTVRISPLEDTIVAVRPVVPVLPFAVPDSSRPLNPMMPIGAKGDVSKAGLEAGFNNTDATGNPIAAITNEVADFGWEYVFHCHILSHEEMDMMRPVTVHVGSVAPDPPLLTFVRGSVILTWSDGTPVDYADPTTWGNPKNEIGYRIERATQADGPYTLIADALANSTRYTDKPSDPTTTYFYRVSAYNQANIATGGTPSNVITVPGLPAAPTALTAAAVSNPTLASGYEVALGWVNNAPSTTSIEVERAVGVGAFAPLATLPANASAYTDSAVVPGDYSYRVRVIDPIGPSVYSNTASVTVPKPGSTTVVLSSPNPSIVGQLVDFTATVSPVLATGTPTGTVTYAINGGTIQVALDTSGVARLAVSTLPIGTHTVTAAYGGDAIFTASSGSVDQVVQPGTTSTVLSGTPNPSVNGDNVTFTATVSATGIGAPTGDVAFFDGATSLGSSALTAGVATVSASVVGVGTHAITAVYAGDPTFTGSTGNLTQVVAQGTTSVAVASTANPSVYGTQVTFTAAVSVVSGVGTPTGNVGFFDNGVSLGSSPLSAGTASFATADLSVGGHPITAVYSGDASFAGSTGSMTQAVDKGTTSVSLSSSVNPSVEGDNVTFTATVSLLTGVGPTSGTVQFFDGVQSLGTAALSGGVAGISSTTLTAGSHAITAAYSGDGNFTGATSAGLTQQVLRRTTTVVTSNRSPSAVFGQSITFTATVAPATGTGTPTGAVQFSIDGINVGVIVNLNAQGRATYSTNTLSAGSHTIAASYSGSVVFGSSASAPFTQVVNMAVSTTFLTSNRNPAVFGQGVTFTARVTPVAATGTVQFSIDGAPTGGPVPLDATGRARLTVNSLSLGTHSVSAVYGGSINYLTSISNNLVQTVNKAASRTVVTSSGNPANRGTNVVFTAAVTAVAPGAGLPRGTVQFRIDGLDVGPLVALDGSGRAQYPTSTLAVGRHTVSAVYNGDANFNASTSVSITQRIR
ncbi:MAG TPA: Ig-like domain repeat protein, partial [Ilumatobacteraceae bacterium]